MDLSGKVNEWTRLAHTQHMAGATPAPATKFNGPSGIGS
jgi:hypothetical protein